MYENRLIDNRLKELLEYLPAILIEGAKAVGKTETAAHFSKTKYQLDNPMELEILKSNPKQILTDTPPVLIDEWQLAPDVWSFIRHAVDDGLPDGSVLMTGSSINVHKRIHSGAGRIVRLKMRPYSVEERSMSEKYIRISDFLGGKINGVSGKTDVTLTEILDEIFRSGFPGIRARNERARNEMLDAYIENIVYHEFEENGYQIKKPDGLIQLIKAFAAAVATTTSFQKILEIALSNSDEAPSKPTAASYKEALKTLNVITEIPAWLPMGKLLSNLGKAPKYFLLDTALVPRLLSLSKGELTQYQTPKPIGKLNKTFIGQLFESFVFQSLIVYADMNKAELSHLRQTKGQHEIEFILQKGKKVIAIEVKSSNVVHDEDVKHLNWFETEVGEEYQVTKLLVNAGAFAYTRQDNVHVVPAVMLGC